MGLFDFLKPKKDNDDLSVIRNDPQWRPLIVEAQVTKLVARCTNLKSVGRELEARQLAVKFLKDLGKDCLKKEFWESTEMISMLANASIHLDEVTIGKQVLDILIKSHGETKAKDIKDWPAIDLTQPYIDAGRLAHQMRDSRGEEYRCYWLAAAALPPTGCKNPASFRQKALAHDFAYSLCSVEALRDPCAANDWLNRKVWHDAKRREFAPECDWDDDNAKFEWITGESLSAPDEPWQAEIIDSPEPLTDSSDQPLSTEIEKIREQSSKLEMEGKSTEAARLISGYLLDAFDDWRANTHDPAPLRKLAIAGFAFKKQSIAYGMLRGFPKYEKDGVPLIDLTGVYLDIGRLGNDLGIPPEEEFAYYEKAVNAEPPPGATYRASGKLKAAACKYASLCGHLVFSPTEAMQKDITLKLLADAHAPEIDWNDTDAFADCVLMD